MNKLLANQLWKVGYSTDQREEPGGTSGPEAEHETTHTRKPSDTYTDAKKKIKIKMTT